MISFPYILYAVAIISAIFIGFIIQRLFYYWKFKTNKIKRVDSVRNLKDFADKVTVSNRAALLKINTVFASSTKRPVINLPTVYNTKEMQFIDEWYMEEGILQLKQTQGREFVLLKDKPPVPGCKYVNVADVMVTMRKRDNRTLVITIFQLPKTVKLLLLNEWIK